MSKPISIFPILALAALALLIVGCGGGDEATGSANGGASSVSGPPTKAEFIKQAEAICEKARKDRYAEVENYWRAHRSELEPLDPTAREEEVDRAITIPGVLKEAREVGALPMPTGDAKTIAAFVAGIEVGVKKARAHPYSISHEIGSVYPFTKANDLIRSYGITDCENPG